MVTLETGLRLVGGVVLLLANGFFVTTEFALTRVRQFPREEFQGVSGLERAWTMTERLEIYLSGCQLGITISSVGLGVVAEPAVAAVLAPLFDAVGVAGSTAAGGHTAIAVLTGLAIINLMHVIVGEQAPTYLGIERTKFVARYGGPVLYWWTRVMGPVIVLADRVAKGLLGLFGVDITRSWTDEEVEDIGVEVTDRADLRRTMGDALGSVGLTDERREEVLNALAIGEIPVSDVMVDREDIVALSTTDDLTTNLELVRREPRGRFPLVGDALEDYVGVVYTPALLAHLEELQAGDVDLAGVAAPPMTLGPDTVVSDAIDQFQANNQELALVFDGGEVVGLLTATDAFEAITGELEDPLDL